MKLLFALNGAQHDAAIGAWGAKLSYDSSRPITLIRHIGGRGQSSDLALRGWRGNPADPGSGIGGVGWIRAVEWSPTRPRPS